MKCLVTGGLGFIGSNLAEKLVAQNHEVHIIDNYHTGNEENIREIKNKIKLHKMSSGELEKCGQKFELIFHNGIYSSTPMYKDNPLLTGSVTYDWLKILEYARKNESKIVYASTSSMYNGQKPPHREDMEVKITDFYSEARLYMERLAQLYDSLYKVCSVGLRYFSVYGPHEKSKGNYANLISQFLWSMNEDKKPVIYGDGTQTRDFTFVEDIVEANLLASAYKKTDVFNAGTGRETSINEAINILNQKLHKKIQPEYVINPLKNYVTFTQADTKKAEQLLKFKAKVKLEDGIDQLIKYYM